MPDLRESFTEVRRRIFDGKGCIRDGSDKKGIDMLRAYNLGDLTSLEMELVGRHLSCCTRCYVTYEGRKNIYFQSKSKGL